MLPDALTLDDLETVADLNTFLARARSIQDGQAALHGTGSALAVYVPVLFADALGATVPTILGLRVARLAAPLPEPLQAVYDLGALTDRLTRMAGQSPVLSLPPAQSRAAWTGVTPPLGGWRRKGEYDDGALRSVADAGMRAVAGALPENAGKPVLDTVRSRIWSSPAAGFLTAGDSVLTRFEGGDSLPAGAAFAAHGLGFLREDGNSVLFEAGRWLRLSSAGGHVLVRQPASLR